MIVKCCHSAKVIPNSKASCCIHILMQLDALSVFLGFPVHTVYILSCGVLMAKLLAPVASEVVKIRVMLAPRYRFVLMIESCPPCSFPTLHGFKQIGSPVVLVILSIHLYLMSPNPFQSHMAYLSPIRYDVDSDTQVAFVFMLRIASLIGLNSKIKGCFFLDAAPE